MKKQNILLFFAFLICGFALSFSFVEYAYPESDTQNILYQMCIQKLKHGMVDDCSNILYSVNGVEKTIHNVISSDIGVILSNTCIAMINNNITSNCPNYDTIKSTFPNIIVDPNSDIINRIRLITMVTSLPDYKIKPNSTNTEYNSVTNSFDYVMGKSRHVDNSCNQATITVNDYLFLLGDTINYMTNNCDEDYTNANTIIQWSKKATTINHYDFRHYNYTAWLDYTIQNCTKQYGLCK